MKIKTSKIELFVDPNQEPPVYWVKCQVDLSDDSTAYQADGFMPFENTISESGNFVLTLLVAPSKTSHLVKHTVDLGPAPFTSKVKGLEIVYQNREGGLTKGGVVLTADATVETR